MADDKALPGRAQNHRRVDLERLEKQPNGPRTVVERGGQGDAGVDRATAFSAALVTPPVATSLEARGCLAPLLAWVLSAR